MAYQEVRQSPDTKPGFFYGYIIVAAAMFIMVVIFGSFFTFGVFFSAVNPIVARYSPRKSGFWSRKRQRLTGGIC